MRLRDCLNCDLRGFVGMGCDLLCNVGREDGAIVGAGDCLNCDLRGFVGMGCDLLCNDVGEDGAMLRLRDCLNCDLRGFVGMGCDLLCNDVGREDGAIVGVGGLSEVGFGDRLCFQWQRFASS